MPAFPGYTPPLYFVTHDLERLWCVLHLHDWRELLAHSRVRLFAGADCVQRALPDWAPSTIVFVVGMFLFAIIEVVLRS